MKNPADSSFVLEAIVSEQLAGSRLDQALAALFPDYSRSCLQSWIHQGRVQVEGALATRPRSAVTASQRLMLRPLAVGTTSSQQAAPQPIVLEIVYEDESMLVINKPPGLVVHPAPGHPDGTLVNALLHHAPLLCQLPRAGLVHRLDQGTSGLLAVAKTLKAYTSLVRQLQARSIQRHYVTLVAGAIISGGRIEAPISRHPRERQKMAVALNGKPALTEYRVRERFPNYTLLDVRLTTGRTHQIRVHMAHLHIPIVGDRLYGGPFRLPPQASSKLAQALRKLNHQALHACRLGVCHPISGEDCAWEVPMPQDMIDLLKLLRCHADSLQHESLSARI